MTGEIVREATFDPAAFADELESAAANRNVGTTLRFENDTVRVWEIRLEPGERAPFHAHVWPYFWTNVDAGEATHRSPDGTLVVVRYEVGDTAFAVHSKDAPGIHDLENSGGTVLRFVTVELPD
jgi:hypothetical protein